MKFQAEQINYFKRIRKEFLLSFLVLTGAIIYIHLTNDSVDIWTTSLLILTTGFALGISAHLTAKINFHEVEISDQLIILRGDYINKPLIVEFPINNTNIFIKSKGKGRGTVEYYVRFQYNTKNYDINRLFNWNYKILLKLFHSFKQAKNEKIIWDEKYLLEFMEKKSKGMSNVDIAFRSN